MKNGNLLPEIFYTWYKKPKRLVQAFIKNKETAKFKEKLVKN